MDNAITPVLPMPAGSADGFASRLLALPARAKVALVGGIAVLVAIVLTFALVGNQGDYKVLYANLSDKDGGAIIAQLSQMNVPYRHAEGGTAILVPAAMVHDVRLKLANAGLPKGGTVGFELMDNARFGQTQFQERLTFQRGLEGELVRSITSIAAVEAARVHLALPNQNGFFREQQKPSASVVLTVHPGRALDRSQIAGIVHLVSSSVPEMSPKSVSVLDQSGALLSGQDGADNANGLDAQQLEYVAQIENNYRKRVADIIEPLVGRENFRATVTAEVDFSQVEATSEEYKPNQGGAPATIRSQQSSESASSTPSTPSGVPGATSNQPPVPATAPINGAAAPLQTAQATGGGSGNNRRDNVTNYEVDKTVRVTRAATGTVKRLNAAVVLNHHINTDARGKTTVTPYTSEDLNKLTELAQQAIGFNKERGDSVRVINVPFKVDAQPKPEAVPLWQQPWLQDLLRTAAMPMALALAAMVIIFGFVRPALKMAAPPQPPKGANVNAVVGDEPPSSPNGRPALEGPSEPDRVAAMRELAKSNPVAVANIVRDWVGSEV